MAKVVEIMNDDYKTGKVPNLDILIDYNGQTSKERISDYRKNEIRFKS